MSVDPVEFLEDKALAERVVHQDETAIREFYKQMQEPITSMMLARFGARHAQLAVDGVREVLGECAAAYRNRKGLNRPPRLSTYRGGAPLMSCVSSWCRCRILDKIKAPHPASLDAAPDDDGGRSGVAELPAADIKDPDQIIVEQVRRALSDALAEASPEGVVLMRLAFLYGVPQKELARAWQRDKGSISKKISSALEEIQHQVISQLREWEPDLTLEWEDILALGEASSELLWDDVAAPDDSDGEFNATFRH